MAVKGLVGAVYESDAAPIPDNIALIFDWTLEVQHRKEYTYGPEIHGVPTGWYVKAESYWVPETMSQGRYFVRLFIGKGNDRRCFVGQIELPAMKHTDAINETEIRIEGIGQLIQEG
jgi:hypothetical protein